MFAKPTSPKIFIRNGMAIDSRITYYACECILIVCFRAKF